VEPFDEAALAYPWRNPDPRVDALCEELQDIVRRSEKLKRSRAAIFERIWDAAHAAVGGTAPPYVPPESARVARAAIPYLDEPWYC
jgi:hypothetical protein